jgi:hypothetical protein
MKTKENIMLQAMTLKADADKAYDAAKETQIEAARMLDWLIEYGASATTIANAAEVLALAEVNKKIANEAAFKAGTLTAKLL